MDLDRHEKGFIAAFMSFWLVAVVVNLFIWFAIFMIAADFFDWGITITDKL